MERLRPITATILGQPILVEEFIKTEQGGYQLPTEYKCHVFGKKVGAIEVIRRRDNSRARHRYYTAQWTAFEDPMDVDFPLDERLDPPRCLEEMLGRAVTLGKPYGTYVRADFYSSDTGCVFGEFSSTPGRDGGLTPVRQSLL